MLGKWLEFSVQTDDVGESLSFYKALGFTEVESSDVWTHRHAVVTDGDICIGLHERVFDSPSLTLVQADLAKHARAMTDSGYDFSFMRIDEDVFNEIGFTDRDGHMISLIEARTFPPPDEDVDDSLCGRWVELTLPVRDVMQAGFFWAPLAPAVHAIRQEPTMHMRFDVGGLALGLSESIALKSPALCFKWYDTDALDVALERHGIASEKFPGYEGAARMLEAPEGTRLYLFKEDFLGEGIEVAEGDDAAGMASPADD